MKQFNGFASFARHLMRTAAIGEEVSSHLAKEGGKVVQKDAQARIGEYQDGVGEFTAWANLAESTVNDRLSKGFSPDDPLLRTGSLRDSIEVHEDGAEVVVGSASDIALYQECGTDKIPPRPFLGPAGFTSREKIERGVGLGTAAWVAGVGWKRPAINLEE